MPFKPDKEYKRLSRLLNAASHLKRELGENVTLDDGIDRRRYHEQKAEGIYETYVQRLREENNLSDLEQRHLDRKETQMENHAEKASQLRRDIDALSASGVDMTTPMMEICQNLKEERRRLNLYRQSA